MLNEIMVINWPVKLPVFIVGPKQLAVDRNEK